jgi:hypothetical protein
LVTASHGRFFLRGGCSQCRPDFYGVKFRHPPSRPSSKLRLTISHTQAVHGAAPFSETVHDEAPFEMETVHASVEKGAADSEKPCTAVHPNIKNKRNTDERLKEEFDRRYSVYPRRSARRAALKAYKQARSRGATPETLLDGVKRYAMPATWLNGDCWLDEPEIKLANIPAAPFGNAEGLSMAERIAAAASGRQVNRIWAEHSSSTGYEDSCQAGELG